MGNILFCTISFFLDNHSYRLSCQVCNTANQSRIITKKPVSMKLCKIIKQPWKIIFSCWTFFASCKRNMLPGRFFCCNFRRKIHIQFAVYRHAISWIRFFYRNILCIFLPFQTFCAVIFTVHFQESGQCFFHVLSFCNLINKSMFQQKFWTLKSFRKLLPDRLFYHSGTCKTN